MGTQVLYTSIGQLVIHSAALGRNQNFEVRRNLVVPKVPPSPLDDILREEVAARLITYRKVKDRYVFDGLEEAR